MTAHRIGTLRQQHGDFVARDDGHQNGGGARWQHGLEVGHQFRVEVPIAAAPSLARARIEHGIGGFGGKPPGGTRAKGGGGKEGIRGAVRCLHAAIIWRATARLAIDALRSRPRGWHIAPFWS